MSTIRVSTELCAVPKNKKSGWISRIVFLKTTKKAVLQPRTVWVWNAAFLIEFLRQVPGLSRGENVEEQKLHSFLMRENIKKEGDSLISIRGTDHWLRPVMI